MRVMVIHNQRTHYFCANLVTIYCNFKRCYKTKYLKNSKNVNVDSVKIVEVNSVKFGVIQNQKSIKLKKPRNGDWGDDGSKFKPPIKINMMVQN